MYLPFTFKIKWYRCSWCASMIQYRRANIKGTANSNLELSQEKWWNELASLFWKMMGCFFFYAIICTFLMILKLWIGQGMELCFHSLFPVHSSFVTISKKQGVKGISYKFFKSGLDYSEAHKKSLQFIYIPDQLDLEHWRNW